MNTPDVLSISEAKELLTLWKLGKLFEVQDWIGSGKSLRVPADLKVTPLKVALGTGFHSLVEVLAQNESEQEEKNRALRQAVSQRRLDFVEILVSYGAEIESAPFIDMLRSWQPPMISYFLDRGSDFIKDSPFAIAFGAKIRTTLGAWRKCREQHPEFAPELQEQADRALRHFCLKGEPKWVSLMMWVGANPRSIGPTLDDEEDEEEYLSALTAAAYAKNVQILKLLQPNPNIDDISGLLECAAALTYKEILQYLFELGAKPNDKRNGGSTALDSALLSFDYEIFRHRLSPARYHSPKAPKYRVSEARETIKLLLDHGALWRPDEVNQIATVRRLLCQCEPDVTLELIELFLKHSACAPEVIHNLIRTPGMKEHLAPVVRYVVRLGFDIRTPKQKLEDEKQEEKHRQWAVVQLASRYDREKVYGEIWAEPIQHVAKRYKLSDVGLAKVSRKLDIPRPGRGYWAIKAAGKPLPKRPPLPELSIQM